MALAIRSYTVTVGLQQRLDLSQGEDREFILTFLEPPVPIGTGAPVDLTGLAEAKLTVRDTQGQLVFARSCVGNAPIGDPKAGTLGFLITQTDTRTQAVQTYTADVQWTDAGGFTEQLLAASPFPIALGVGEPGDPVTSPPASPVVYGLRWLGAWSSTTAYLINDAVTYSDPNGGSPSRISSFRCLASNTNVPPLDGGGALSVNWAYVAERGATGAQGPSGGIGAVNALPMPSIIYRAMTAVLKGAPASPGPGSMDILYVCLKLADDTYGWFAIGVTP